MKTLNFPSRVLNQVTELYRIRSDQQRRDRAVAAAIVFLALAAGFYFLA